MRVCVTGGTGVVGRSLVTHLVASGHRVTSLARSASGAETVRRLGAEPVQGDVLDPVSLDTLVAGAEWVFHVAGVNEMCSRDPDHMDRVNVDGTRNVLEAARRAGASRLIHTSSAVTIGESRGEVGSESSSHRGHYLSRYERSKHLSEQLVLSEAGDLDVVAVNPSSVQGPGRATGTGKLVLDVVNGRLPFLIDTSVSIVDIDDCARGHVLAAEKGRRGERYLLSGASFRIGEVVTLLASVTGRELKPRFLPGWLATAGASVVEGGARLMRRHPPVCREMVRVLRAGHTYDGSRATRELGLEYTPFPDTISKTMAWFESRGLLA